MRIAIPSMIVNDLYVSSALRGPDEADSPLLVYADAVLAFPIVLEGLEAVARRNLQILKGDRPVQLRKLAQCWSLDVHPTLDAFALEEGASVLALEALDRHA